MSDRAAHPHPLLMHRDEPGTSTNSSSANASAAGPSNQAQVQVQGIALGRSQSLGQSSGHGHGPSLSQNQTRLPSIPTLPPIQIPRSTLHPSPASAPDSSLGANGSAGLRVDEPQPGSTRSEESFATARTSSPADAPLPDATPFTVQVQAHGPSSASQLPPGTGTSLLRTLPKSLSVDSFHREQRQQRDGTESELRRAGSPGAKTNGGLSGADPPFGRPATSAGFVVGSTAAASPPVPSPSPSATHPASASTPRILSSGIRTLASRVRRRSRHGGSFAEEDENESSAQDDSEFEQGRSSSAMSAFGSGSGFGARSLGRKSVTVGAAGQEVEMPAPSRRRLVPPKRSGSMPTSRSPVQPTPCARNRKGTVGAHPTLPSINTAIAIARPPTVSDSPSLRTKASVPTPLDASRSRSHSIGTQSDDSTYKQSRMPTSTSADVDKPAKDAIAMTLAVIGSQGCGKSAFIRRAWKFSHVSEPELQSVTAKDNDGLRVIHYSVRKAYMEAYEGRDYHLTLIEISVHELLHVDGEIHGDAWPTCLPPVDGIFVLYDASDRSSFIHTEELIQHYYSLKIPYIVLACKSDLTHRIAPQDAVQVVYKYDGGIVEISNNDVGKEKARRCVGVLLRGVQRRRYGDIQPHANPCSPGLYNVPAPWEAHPSPLSANSVVNSARPLDSAPTSATFPATGYPSADIPTPSPQLPSPPPAAPQATAAPPADVLPLPPVPALSFSKTLPDIGGGTQQHIVRLPSAPTSPTRARSMSDLMSAQQLMLAEQNTTQQSPKQRQSVDQELIRSRSIVDLARVSTKSAESFKPPETEATNDIIPIFPLKREPKQPAPPSYSTLDELLEKLFFLAVSGDDTSFITHFFLTYRRFTTPRRILLAMQKRMIELNQPCSDVTLAGFAQLRICNLLEQWIHGYPNDFSVYGTAGALNALIRQILRQTHTLYYGSDFLPFVDMLPTLHDLDAAWAMKVETSIMESDESDDNYGSDGSDGGKPSNVSPKHRKVVPSSSDVQPSATRERKSSIPLSSKFLQSTLPGSVRTQAGPYLSSSSRDMNTRLVRASNGLLHFDADDIAREITRRELELYMKIVPRDWLRHTLVTGRKDPNHDRISRFNAHYNELHDWAASMILCHDKARQRAKVVEKLAEVAVRLRSLNNYSALRAMITAITASTHPSDEVMEIFKTKTDIHKKYLSSDILMRTSGAHQSYRLALRNTNGPCIPCLEVHTSDLRRAHEGNPDFKPGDNSQIHWAKFSMLGKFVDTLTQIQNQCRGQPSYQFNENPHLGNLFDVPLMDYDMQQERLGPPPEEDADLYAAPLPPTSLVLDHQGHSRDAGVIKRLFFWSNSS